MTNKALSCFAACLLVTTLTGCGVDGEPTPPPPKPTNEPGIRVSGDARVGVTITQDAVALWSLETGGFKDRW